MHIHFERSGGFMGTRIEATINTEDLPPEEAQKVTSLIEEASFFDLPSAIASPTPGADQFQYRVTVESEERKHTVEIGDAAIPEDVQPLLRQLTILARGKGPSSG